MVLPSADLVAVSSNRGAAYDLVLLAHVLAALVGFGAVGVAGLSALTLVRRGASSESLRRYYRPGVNWAGRILFLVPVLGVVLIVMSRGGWSFADGWVGAGLVLWAVAASAAELVLWPAERELQRLVTDGGFDPGEHRGLGLRAAGVSAALLVLFVVATVVMVSKP
jgi:hypothetical protein